MPSLTKFLAIVAYPNQSAIGKRILIRIQTPEPVWVEIIGVVAHERGVSLSEPGREQVYLPDAYIGSGATDHWALRSATIHRSTPTTFAPPSRHSTHTY